MKIGPVRRNLLGKSVRFGLLSGFSFFATIGLTMLWVEVFAVSPLPAHVITLVLVFFLNFAGLIVFVFPGHTNNLSHAFLSFLASTLAFRVLEWAIFALLVTVAALDYRIAILVVVPVFSALKFLFLNRFTFDKKGRDTIAGNAPVRRR